MKKLKVEVYIPVYNEEKDLPKCIVTLSAFLKKNFEYSYQIIIADNASKDNTKKVGQELSKKYKDVSYEYIDRKGRGFALKKLWMKSNADIMSYMDVDLSTDLKHFIPLINALVKDGYDIAIGSRLMEESAVKRSFKREFFSRGYNILRRIILPNKFKDGQCGFKAITKTIAKEVVPKVNDKGFFFDSEMLIIAEKKGFKIKEIPVKWIEDTDTTLKVPRTVADHIGNLLRMRFRVWFEKL